LLVIAVTFPSVGIVGALVCALAGSALGLPAVMIMLKRDAAAEQRDK
jgi:hypothetical protein